MSRMDSQKGGGAGVEGRSRSSSLHRDLLRCLLAEAIVKKHLHRAGTLACRILLEAQLNCISSVM